MKQTAKQVGKVVGYGFGVALGRWGFKRVEPALDAAADNVITFVKGIFSSVGKTVKTKKELEKDAA